MWPLSSVFYTSTNKAEDKFTFDKLEISKLFLLFVSAEARLSVEEAHLRNLNINHNTIYERSVVNLGAVKVDPSVATVKRSDATHEDTDDICHKIHYIPTKTIKITFQKSGFFGSEKPPVFFGVNTYGSTVKQCLDVSRFLHKNGVRDPLVADLMCSEQGVDQILQDAGHTVINH